MGSSLLFCRSVSSSWIRSRAAGTGTSTPMGCTSHRCRLSLPVLLCRPHSPNASTFASLLFPRRPVSHTFHEWRPVKDLGGSCQLPETQAHPGFKGGSLRDILRERPLLHVQCQWEAPGHHRDTGQHQGERPQAFPVVWNFSVLSSKCGKSEGGGSPEVVWLGVGDKWSRPMAQHQVTIQGASAASQQVPAELRPSLCPSAQAGCSVQVAP